MRSDIRACSNSAIARMLEKNRRPTAVEVSMSWSSTMIDVLDWQLLGQLNQMLQ